MRTDILNDAEKQVFLFLLPLMLGKFELPEANEFEHAVAGSCSWDHEGYEIPILFCLDEGTFTKS